MILLFLGYPMPNSRRRKHLEHLIVQSYDWVLRAPRTINGLKAVSLARHGHYEVALVEASDMAQDRDLSFWVELFDNMRNISIDSYAGDDIEETATAVQRLISQAELLDHGSN
jgi:hypothetical protein